MDEMLSSDAMLEEAEDLLLQAQEELRAKLSEAYTSRDELASRVEALEGEAAGLRGV